jgi:hypothetical protein
MVSRRCRCARSLAAAGAPNGHAGHDRGAAVARHPWRRPRGSAAQSLPKAKFGLAGDKQLLVTASPVELAQIKAAVNALDAPNVTPPPAPMSAEAPDQRRNFAVTHESSGNVCVRPPAPCSRSRPRLLSTTTSLLAFNRRAGARLEPAARRAAAAARDRKLSGSSGAVSAGYFVFSGQSMRMVEVNTG